MWHHEPHEYHETSDKCAVCHKRNCLNSFDEDDIEVDDQGEWDCPECKSVHVMIHDVNVMNRPLQELFIKFMMRMELPTVGQPITITRIKEFSNVPGIGNKLI